MIFCFLLRKVVIFLWFMCIFKMFYFVFIRFFVILVLKKKYIMMVCGKKFKNKKILYNLYNIGWGVFVVCSYGIEDDDDVGEVGFY